MFTNAATERGVPLGSTHTWRMHATLYEYKGQRLPSNPCNQRNIAAVCIMIQSDTWLNAPFVSQLIEM